MSTNSLKADKNERLYKFQECKKQIQAGINRIYLYKSKALKEAYDEFQKTQPEFFHQEYEPNPFNYQYDLEFYIFLNYNDIRKREIELSSNDLEAVMFAEHGATLLPRSQHLIHAMSIRWPEKKARDGSIISDLAITPWLEDLIHGFSFYQNTVVFGGAGQGKTYGSLAFGAVLYDHFIYTQSGAQFSISTVSQSKLEGSAWSYLNRLYNSNPGYKYSSFAQRAFSAGDFTFRRKKDPRDNKYIKEGGTIKGVLLAKGRTDASVMDKLTGSHSCIARFYLLDEAQSTPDAPLRSYTNMYLHPRYKWFGMSGNYEEDGDLLDLNAEPKVGWQNVNEETHTWEGTLRTSDSNLGITNYVIHYNNDLSPAILDPEIEKKYGKFMPTLAKKNELYQTKESRQTYEYKRMWIGFRFAKETNDSVKVLSDSLLQDCGCYEKPPGVTWLARLASFDSAPASKDRNPFTIFDIGLDKNEYPIVRPHSIHNLPKPESQMEYYGFTTLNIVKLMNKYNVYKGGLIQDFTQFTALVEMLNKHGIFSHIMIYHQGNPKGEVNEITKKVEKPVELPLIKTLSESGFEKSTRTYAHERVENRITLGAYIMRMFIEKRRVVGLTPSILDGVEGHHGFEKEFLSRNFITNSKQKGVEKIKLETKDAFKGRYKFSPDILDTFFQIFYLIYVVFGIKPNQKGLGSLETNISKKEVEEEVDVWYARRRFR